MVKIVPGDPYGRRGVIDLDGTLNTFIGWTGKYEIYPPLEGAEEFLQRLIDDGWELVLATARPDIDEIKWWLTDVGWDKYFVEVWEKPFGMWYLDDKNIYFDGSYNNAYISIRQLEAWYNKKNSKFFQILSNLRLLFLEFLNMLSDFYKYEESESSSEISF